MNLNLHQEQTTLTRTNTICEVRVSMTLSVHTGYDNTQNMAQYLGLHDQANISEFINIEQYTYVH